MAKYDDMSFGKAFAAARKDKGAGKTFTWKGNSYTTDRADDKKKSTGAAKTSTDSVVDRARAAIDRAEGEKPYKMRPVARPKRDMSQEPTATKVETPKVTTTQIPPGEGAARTAIEYDRQRRAEKSGGASTRGPAGSPRGTGRTLSNITLADWAKMSPAERKEFGLPTSRGAARAMLEGTATTATPRSRPGGSTARGYAKGGMVKANCGASMKPTQKGTKK
jgi:hypothetical protein